MHWRVLPALAMACAACVAYAQARPFTLVLSTANHEVKVGDPVDIRVVMTNISNHDVDCTTNGSNALDRSYEYKVRNERGQRVRRIEKEYHGGSSIWPCILKPGQSDTPSGGRISVLYDFSRPGSYDIQVSRRVLGDDARPGTFGKGSDHMPIVESNTITVTVVGAELGSKE